MHKDEKTTKAQADKALRERLPLAAAAAWDGLSESERAIVREAAIKLSSSLDTRASLTIGPLTIFDDGEIRVAEGTPPKEIASRVLAAVKEYGERERAEGVNHRREVAAGRAKWQETKPITCEACARPDDGFGWYRHPSHPGVRHRGCAADGSELVKVGSSAWD